MKKESIPVRNSLFLLLTATIWGIAFVAQSVSMDYIGGFTFNSIRKPYWFTDAFAGHPASQQAKICRRKKQIHRHRPTAEDPDHRRYLLWHHSLPCK